MFLFLGLVDHTDSLGNAGRYGFGDLQWMTAGKGIVHGEMFPLVNKDKGNPTKFFQIWLNLPRADKMCDPNFVMHWGEDVPQWLAPDGKAHVTVWAGKLNQVEPLTPPLRSWARDPDHAVAVWHICLPPGAQLTLPPASMSSSASTVNRVLYWLEGSSLQVGGRAMVPEREAAITLGTDFTFQLTCRVSIPCSSSSQIQTSRVLTEPTQHCSF
jgi:redox-sensitive bicupin YhaK (pirin superfamily)